MVMSNAQAILSFLEDFALYFTISIFLLGSLGNLINLCVLITLKLFRSNQCAFYLIIESIADTCQLSVIFIMHIMPLSLGYELGNVSIVWCKLKNMLPQTLRLISTSMVCFAALDQFLFTNPQPLVRQMSTIRLAHRLTIAAVCLWTLHSIPYGIFYRISSSQTCAHANVALTHYYSFFYYPILHGFLPLIASSLLSLLAYRNVRRLVRHQVNIERRRLDRQLTAMIFVRVICFVLFLLPYTVYRIYALNISVSRANAYPYAVHRLAFTIASSLSNLNYAISFYIFMATSSRYRGQVTYFFIKKCWRRIKTLCCTKRNVIHPSGGISNAVGTENNE